MATGFLTRSLLTTRQTLSTAFSRSYTSLSLSTPPSSISSLSSFSIIRLRPLVTVAPNLRNLSPTSSTVRGFSTRRTSNSLNDPNPNWSNRPPKETILLDGCDFEHWLVVLEKPEGDPTRDEIIDSYIKTLAMVVGSEEEARMKIYSVSTRCYYAFGALVSEELSYKIKELPKVRWVLPDSYLDVRNKDYGGEPFINGQAVPYDPKYHEEWVRNNARANERNRRNDRPRNHDRSRNFERRRENMMQNREMQNPVSNMAGMPPHNVGGPSSMGGPPPNNMGNPQPNMGGVQHNSMGGPPNMGGRLSNNMGNPPNMVGMPPQNNMGGMTPHNVGGGPPNNLGGPPPPYMGGGPPNNMSRMPPNQMGGVSNNAPNTMGGPPPPYVGGGPPNNMSGMPPNQMGGVPNNASNYQYRNGPNNGGMPYQSGPGPNRERQNSYSPNMASGNPYPTQDMPGRDMPPPSNYQ